MNSGIVLLNPNTIIKSRKLTLIHSYHRIHTPHSGSSKCPSMCFIAKHSSRGSRVLFGFQIFLLQYGVVLQSFLDFQGLDSFEYYRPVVLYSAPNFIFSDISSCLDSGHVFLVEISGKQCCCFHCILSGSKLGQFVP